ncbi:T9SS type A sorting domain-containing protein [uncultured Tenacibaculum sp.]|uniref:T9SS type A sorting domain-containing protein n=1 Tax=uncultured Tenacibaculum sp. TaxID=174713 RepID=UPI0026322129|nr:T9SS type A sorting domain-containing protein [uncultured Tenacibaculum sp.]
MANFSVFCQNPDQIVNIPDPVFKEFLVYNHDVNGDGEIQYGEAYLFTGEIDISRRERITDLTGLEAFENITKLNCDFNDIEYLDKVLFNLKKLEVLKCSHNSRLKSLDVSKNINLKLLYCGGGYLSHLDLSKNLLLEEFALDNNKDMDWVNLKNGNNSNLRASFYTTDIGCIQQDREERYSHWQFSSSFKGTFSANCDANLHIPDPIFKTFLVGNNLINLNGDSEIQKNEAESYTGELLLDGLGISDLTGVEYFYNIRTLSCANNSISILNVDNNILLEKLNCSNNTIGYLDISKNILLKELNCENNALVFLNLKNGANSEIERGKITIAPNDLLSCVAVDNVQEFSDIHRGSLVNLNASLNEESCIGKGDFIDIPDVSFKSALLNIPEINLNGDDEIQILESKYYEGSINVNNKNIENLDGIESFRYLKELYCIGNKIKKINVEHNEYLEVLSCGNNELENLDLSKNTSLTTVYCANNKLLRLNMKNGKNGQIDARFNSFGNPNLTCIQVDSPDYVESLGWVKDSTSSFNSTCDYNDLIVSIPDPIFKNALVTDDSVNLNGDSEIQLVEAEQVSSLGVSDLGIQELTGIEDFINLKVLNCSGNELTSLDLSENRKLEYLNCSNNKLDFINIKNRNNEKLKDNDVDFSGNETYACIQVDNREYAVSEWRLKKDRGAVFSIDCVDTRLVVNIPDDEFKRILLINNEINTNNDHEIQVSEALVFAGEINTFSNGISDLTGIEAFEKITGLKCKNNNLTSLDISNNKELINLECTGNELIYINLSENLKLERLLVDDNNLQTLDISNNTELTSLDCSKNELTSINITGNLKLEELFANNNNLQTIDTSANTSLSIFSCISNEIDELNLTNNTSLLGFSCEGNNLTTLDVSNNLNLRILYCSNNELTDLDVSQNTALVELLSRSNKLESLNLKNGNNANFTNMNVTGNLDLTCIQVDSKTYSDNTWSTLKDVTAEYREDCNISSDAVVIIPDANFKDFLVSNTAINTNGDGEIQVAEAKVYSGTIDVSDSRITNLQGIEYFTEITNLNCSRNDLTELNVTQNTKLINLNCSSNDILTLDITENHVLENLNCSSNILIGLYLYKRTASGASTNNSLVSVDCSSNELSSLDISYNASLENLTCSYNKLESLDVSRNNQLKFLNCFSNKLEQISLSNNSLLEELYSGSNNLTSINVSANTSLVKLNLKKNKLQLLDVSNNLSLVSLGCDENELSSLDLSKNSKLINLDCRSNNLVTLNVKNGNNVNFEKFRAESNSELTCIQVDDVTVVTNDVIWRKDSSATFNENCGTSSEDVVYIPDANFKTYLLGNTAINTNGDDEIQVSEAKIFDGRIDCSSLNINDLTGVEAFVALKTLWCRNNQITDLDISNNVNLDGLDVSDNELTNLDVSKNTILRFLNCSENKLTDLNVSNSSIKTIDCSDNSLTNLNTNNASALEHITCYKNKLTSLDLSTNEPLYALYCFFNRLESLDLSNNPNMKYLNCSYNKTTLTSLNLANGNNTNIDTSSSITGFFDATNNDKLTCIQVDDVTYSSENWTNIDSRASFSENCNISSEDVVYIPDTNFKECLLANTAINTNNDDEIQVSEALAFTGEISCNNSDVSDATGLEAFVNVWSINMSGNNLTILNVSAHKSLQYLYCESNSIEYLFLDNNLDLVGLFCDFNRLTHLDLSKNVKLNTIFCTNNELESLNIKNGNNDYNSDGYHFTDNPNLTCIQVDDKVGADNAEFWFKDATATYSEDCGVSSSDIVYIPDTNFKSVLLADSNINANGDDEIQVSEALGYNGTIKCSSKEIVDLTGIEAFENITELDCKFNDIETINLSKNTKLEILDCSQNELRNIDVRNNTLLERLTVGDNEISILDVSNNSRLTWLSCGSSKLTSLDVSNNLELRTLLCLGNELTTLDVSKNLELEGLYCGINKLTSLNVTNNTKLRSLSFLLNEVKTIDLSKNIDLTDVDCSNNQLRGLDLSNSPELNSIRCNDNRLRSLNVRNGNNTNFFDFSIDFTRNPDLTCIEVDDKAYSDDVWATYKDESASYSEDCGETPEEVIYIPDANFKSVLLADPNINTNGDEEIQISEAINYSGEIDCRDKSIKDLTGVEEFVNLSLLDCSNNEVESINVSMLKKLEGLYAANNQLTSLDLRNGNNYNFSGVDFIDNPNLRCIQVDDKDFSNDVWSSLKDSTAFYSENCSADPENIVYIPDENFKNFLLNNNFINTNGDNEIQYTEAIAYKAAIFCPSRSIEDLTGLEAFTEAKGVFCYDNNISVLDVSKNTKLTELWCSGNPISELDLSNNPLIFGLRCQNNKITSLDLSNNPELVYVIARNNELTTVDLKNGNNSKLTGDVALEGNPNLLCIQVDDVTVSTRSNWVKDDTAVYSENCDATSGVDEEFSNEISIYPNPVKNKVIVSLKNNTEKVQFKIYTLLGNEVLITENKSIDVSNLSKGIYILKIVTENNKVGVKRFVKK